MIRDTGCLSLYGSLGHILCQNLAQVQYKLQRSYLILHCLELILIFFLENKLVLQRLIRILQDNNQLKSIRSPFKTEMKPQQIIFDSKKVKQTTLKNI